MGTIFRVTEGTMSSSTLDNLQLSLQKMSDLQEQMSSGKKINKPSDDPTGTVTAMSYRAQQARTTQYSTNADDAQGWLGTAEDALSTSVTSIQKVQSLTLQGANSTSSDSSRQAIAAEIATVKQGLIGVANTAYNNRPIFAGTANPSGLTPPKDAYDVNGTYNGNSGAINRTVGNGASVQVNVTGPNVFGTQGTVGGTGDDVFGLLDQIQSHLTSSDPAEQNKLTSSWTDSGGNTVPSDVDRLNTALKNIQNQESTVGARYNRVTTMQTRAQNDLVTIQTGLSNTENIDLPKTIVALQLQQTAYQAALSATAKVIQPSLVDFLQ